ncbi:MAG: DNA helicase PcrA [Coriobacteriia bacterium]|nr:DNA helicase PcrA [Coriobacteriia bacterium]
MLDLDTLNPRQKEAVLTIEGPLLVLAGAGSGKTRVLTSRIARLINDLGIYPSQILAITFTNKAAAEMRSRLHKQIGGDVASMWVATFHAMCVRILRADGERIGFTRNFTIYDDDDQKRLVKEIMQTLSVDDKNWTINSIRGRISTAKSSLMSANEYAARASTPPEKVTAQIYAEYERRLKMANAMDFDDLLLNTVVLFEKHRDVLEAYQNRFRYIHVDEYQDTNHAQYKITNLLAEKHHNLMVVGDDDQSIYSWRGADITNILEFEKDYPEAHVVKLEQNYRSTQNILDAANAVVSNNTGRKDKKLFTDSARGEKIKLYLATTEKDEANYIAGEIDRLTADGTHLYGDCAVFYRTNAQSRNFEDAFLRAGIPYRLVGGTKFFARVEIRNVMAYLKVVLNSDDDISVKRIINVPRRALGKTTIDHVSGLAYDKGVTFEAGIKLAVEEGALRSNAITSLDDFAHMLDAMRGMEGGLVDIVEMIVDKSGYLRSLEIERTDESLARAENIKEFVSVVADYAQEHDDEENTLAGFMEFLALRTDLDSVSADDDAVTLMTIHTAKGLEFPVVFVSGLEEGIFPHQNSIFSESGVEEERRLAYVAITRARKQLFLSRAATRMTFGSTSCNPASRFIDEIPNELLEIAGIGSRDYGGFGHDKRGDRRATSSHGAGTSRYLGGSYVFDDAAVATGKSRVASFGSANSPSRKKAHEKVQFAVDDRIDHKTFGRGTVVGASGDSVEIAFDGTAGTKKLLVGYAPIVKIQ